MEGVAILVLISICAIMITVMGCNAVFKKGTYFFTQDVKMKNKNDVKRNKIIAFCAIGVTVAIIAVTIYIASVTKSYDDSGDSEISGEPWKDLGVSKKEYMDVYNKYKYN